MTDPEITALARGYAEEATKTDGIDPNLSASDLNGIKHDIAEYAEEVIRFLLRRYTLVEKSKLEELEIARRVKANGYVALKRSDADYLFPEIAKEVEG